MLGSCAGVSGVADQADRPSDLLRAPDSVVVAAQDTFTLASGDLGGFATPVYSISLLAPYSRQAVVVVGNEYDAATDTHDRWTKTVTAPYIVDAACARHGNEFWVVGHAPTGEHIVERWDWSSLVGGYFTTLDRANTGVGVGVRTPELCVQIAGDTYIAPPARVGSPSVNRVVVHQGPALGEVRKIEVDPDGRYLMLLVRDASGVTSLMQMPATVGSTSVTLLTSATISDLSKTLSMTFGQHARDGRVLVLSTAGETVWLKDEWNDGVFESSGHVDGPTFDTASPPHSWLRWF